jgi:hypothetical protein
VSHHLVDLAPHWIVDAARRRVGVRFDCPTCPSHEGAVQICVLFANPPDGGLAAPAGSQLPGENDGRRWTRSGDALEVMSLQPSVDCSKCGHWHGFLAHGETT